MKAGHIRIGDIVEMMHNKLAKIGRTKGKKVAKIMTCLSCMVLYKKWK